MTFHKLNSLIPKTAAKYGILTEMKAAKFCHNFRKLLPELFPDYKNIHEYIKPESYKAGTSTLTINVSSPAWAQEILMRKEKIIKEMNISEVKIQLKQGKTDDLPEQI